MATKINVIWETNGGHPSTNTQQLDMADGENTISLNPPVTPVRPGFVFANWSIMDTAIEAFPYTYTVPTGEDTVYVVGQWNPAIETTGRAIIVLGVTPPVNNNSGSAGGDNTELENRVTAIEDVLNTPGYETMLVKTSD